MLRWVSCPVGTKNIPFFSEVSEYLHIDKGTSTPLIWCLKSGHDMQYISVSQKDRNTDVQLLGNYLNLPGLLGKRATFFPPAIQHICNYVFLFGYPNTNIMVSATWNNLVSDLNEEEQRHFYLIWTNYDFFVGLFRHKNGLNIQPIWYLHKFVAWVIITNGIFKQLGDWQVHG